MGGVSVPRLGHPNANGADYVVPNGGYPPHMLAWENGILWSAAECPADWLEEKAAAAGLKIEEPTPIDFRLLAEANPKWYRPGPYADEDVEYVDPAPGLGCFTLGCDGFTNFADVAATAVSAGGGRTMFRDRGVPGLDPQMDLTLIALVEELAGCKASDELHSVLIALRNIAYTQLALGVPPSRIIQPVDFLELMTDNTSTMTGKFKGLNKLWQSVRPAYLCFWPQCNRSTI